MCLIGVAFGSCLGVMKHDSSHAGAFLLETIAVLNSVHLWLGQRRQPLTFMGRRALLLGALSDRALACLPETAPCAWLDPAVPALCCSHSPVQVPTTTTSQHPHFEKEEEEAEIESFQSGDTLVCAGSVCSWFTPQIGVRSGGICWRTRHLECTTVASGL